MNEVCQFCSDSGMRVIERPDGTRVAHACECQTQRRTDRLLATARIPERYRHCTLEDYETSFDGSNSSLTAALLNARNFVNGYPIETGGSGLLFTGSIGVGKTHLAVGVLRSLIVNRGAKGLFYDNRELLKLIQNSYNRNSDFTEMDLLQPVFDAEILVLDELGAVRPTDWVSDTVSLIMNTRYNDCKTTIVTTNYLNQSPASSKLDGPRLVIHEETLGDRIGERMRSRLQEMCRIINVTGPDFRQKITRTARV